MSQAARRLAALVTTLSLLAAMAAVAATPALAAATVTVSSLADTSAADGACTLREAITAILTDTSSGGGAAGECIVDAGTDQVLVSVSGTVTLGSTLPAIGASLSIDGGGGLVLDGHDAVRILSITGGSVILSNLAFTRGTGFEGGAITMSGGDLTVSGSTFSDNHAGDIGGAIYMSAGTLTLVSSTFTGNTAATEGGAVNSRGTLNVDDSTFTGNGISGTIGPLGGGLLHHAFTASITNSTFSGNDDGGLVLAQTSATVTDVRITGNTATSCAGLNLKGGIATVARSTIAGNTATNNGGGVCAATFDVSDAAMTLSRSTVSGNSSGGSGGGVDAGDADLTVANSTIAGNTAGGVGGGMRVLGHVGVPTLAVINSTITGNTGGPWGGIAMPSDVVATVTNTIVTANTGGDIQDTGTNVSTTLATSLVGAQATGTLDPRGLRDNGGPTKTIGVLAGTAAVDAGNATVCAAKFISNADQRGRSRTIDVCDIGAVELDKVAPQTPSTPSLALRTGVRLDGTSSRARLTWGNGLDDLAGSGFESFEVQRSVNGGAFTTIAKPTTKSLDVTLAKDTTYAFKVRTIDHDANRSPFASAATVTARLYQQTNSRFTYAKTWTTSTKSSFSGGTARYSKTKGASATFTATGRSFAFVTTIASSRGKVRIYVDGVLDTTLDLAGTTSYRRQAWAKTFSSAGSHTIRIAVLGTSGRPRVDVDAFAVLR